jgi:hypothetical protein
MHTYSEQFALNLRNSINFSAEKMMLVKRRSAVCNLTLFMMGLCLLTPVAGMPAEHSLFESDAVIDIRLSGPLSDVFADTEERNYRSFTLQTGSKVLPLKVRLRGHSRVRVCDFPPLKLNFAEDGAEGSAFEGQDKLKLVTHCNNHDRGEQNVLKEYAAYRIYQALTPVSYRTRLLRIEYVDTAETLPAQATPRFAFVIESIERLAERLGAEPAVLAGLPKHRHDVQLAGLLYVFEYLIGNTDYMLLRADGEAGCCQNIDLLEKDGTVLMVPFDFDLAGLVNPRYAFPDHNLRIDRVTQRLYRGLCIDPSALRAALATIKERESAVRASLAGTAGLEEKTVQQAQKFLDRFFKEAEDEDKLLRKFERSCVESY